MKNSFTQLATLVLLVFIVSCQSSKELHYFKEGNNYYRLKVKQHAFLSSSRYMSGYFDPAAIDEFFGETTRPDSAKITKRNHVKAIDACGEEITGNLVMVLSTNADAVTKEIGGITDNDQLLAMITGLATKNKLNEALQVQEKIKTLLHSINGDVAELSVFENSFTNNITNKEAIKLITNYLNTQAIKSGKLSGIDKIKDIESWLLDQLR